MPKGISFKIFFTFLIIVFALYGYGQAPKSKKQKSAGDWQINYNIGFTQFYGDASNNGYFKKFSGEIAFATGVNVRRYFNSTFGLGLNLWFSGLKSHKDKSATGIPVNFHLTGNYFDGNIHLLVDFNNLFWGPSSRKFSVYGTIGLGYGSWNTQLADSLSGLVINSGDAIGDITFKKGGAVIPVGFGVNYMINNNWAVNFEMNLRTVLNDDVDVWRDGFKYDQPLYTSFGVSYFFNRNVVTKNKTKRKPKKTVVNKPLEPVVPLYDYRLQSPEKASGSTSSDVILIEPPEKSNKVPDVGVVFRVQIFAVRNNLPSIRSLQDRFNISGSVFENYQDGIHRYSTGEFNNYQDALRYSYVLKDKGVYDAFVVAYKDNRRIPITPKMKER